MRDGLDSVSVNDPRKNSLHAVQQDCRGRNAFSVGVLDMDRISPKSDTERWV